MTFCSLSCGRARHDKEKLVRLWDARVPYSNLLRHAVRVLEKQHRAEVADIAVAIERAATGATLMDSTGCDCAAMTATAAGFPTAQGLAACSVPGDMSAEPFAHPTGKLGLDQVGHEPEAKPRVKRDDRGERQPHARRTLPQPGAYTRRLKPGQHTSRSYVAHGA